MTGVMIKRRRLYGFPLNIPLVWPLHEHDIFGRMGNWVAFWRYGAGREHLGPFRVMSRLWISYLITLKYSTKKHNIMYI